jgi:hypothetical protein
MIQETSQPPSVGRHGQGRLWGNADINRQANQLDRSANDPLPTSNGSVCIEAPHTDQTKSD